MVVKNEHHSGRSDAMDNQGSEKKYKDNALSCC